MANQFSITKTIIEANLKKLHGITPTEKLVLICLSGYFGKPENSNVFSCFPSQNRIAREVGCTSPTVNSALQKFERLKFLRANYRSTPEGGNTSKLYTWLGIPTTEEPESECSEETSESDVVEVLTVEQSPTPVELPVPTSSASSPRAPTASHIFDLHSALEDELTNEAPF
ncbi:helix-turn-helix domain-containing protein [Vibrio parahaemolyticus]|uniref:helix-turn-helix domain-containing protein n=1 Tax=Vibrio parahaemolyticus TaxID=670 RepID=UPI001EEB5AB7|nr:helix-turn-helix domain-containing protein [Vibrio parahaemolyticus]MCG6459276.1 helix-turn-helix domain-containing protein [Vibrio parahaemolyticus]